MAAKPKGTLASLRKEREEAQREYARYFKYWTTVARTRDSAIERLEAENCTLRSQRTLACILSGVLVLLLVAVCA